MDCSLCTNLVATIGFQLITHLAVLLLKFEFISSVMFFPKGFWLSESFQCCVELRRLSFPIMVVLDMLKIRAPPALILLVLLTIWNQQVPHQVEACLKSFNVMSVNSNAKERATLNT